jgi:diphosphomevalonate decarboxylase
MDNGKRIAASACPSLALIKYWGKADSKRNIPASSSLAVTLGGLYTVTRVSLREEGGAGGEVSETGRVVGDTVRVAGESQPEERYRAFFDALRAAAGSKAVFEADSENSFPTAAGLASSSSGFAALAVAGAALLDYAPEATALSAIARVGSGSAARSLFGGFTALPAGAEAASQLHGPEHWPELRVLIALTTRERKAHSSRNAMEQVRTTSPYYPVWLDSNEELFREGQAALAERDLERLGSLVRLSYLRMFGTLLAADPPILYWLPVSVRLQQTCDELRRQGFPAWETMDAGPQVKVLTTRGYAEQLRQRLFEVEGVEDVLVAWPGEGARTVPEGSEIERGETDS